MGRSDQRIAEEASGLSYSAECARLADAFEQFVCERFNETGRVCTRHIGKTAQLRHGDLRINQFNAELKFDRLHHETGNYYIEIAERRSSYRTWVNSGIYASSDARWYIVGDYTGVLVFERELLRTVARRFAQLDIERGTSRGFLIEERQALELKTYYQPWRGRTWNGQMRNIE